MHAKEEQGWKRFWCLPEWDTRVLEVKEGLLEKFTGQSRRDEPDSGNTHFPDIETCAVLKAAKGRTTSQAERGWGWLPPYPVIHVLRHVFFLCFKLGGELQI